MANFFPNEKFKALGTDISLTIFADGEGQSAKAANDLLAAREIYKHYQKTFDRFDRSSELSVLNGRLGSFCAASPEMIETARRAIMYYNLTSGYFDPRIISQLENIGYRSDFLKNDFSAVSDPETAGRYEKKISEDIILENGKIRLNSRVDFSGIVKGRVTDQAAMFLNERGWRNFLVDSGGDMRISGHRDGGQEWNIALEGFPSDRYAIRLDKDFPAVATSGISRRKWEAGGKRYHHLINPKIPGRFDFDLKSVTVVARTAEEADVWAKVLFLMGHERGMEHSKKHNIRSVFLFSSGNLSISE